MENESAAARAKFRVVGDVQNVGYRHWAAQLARARGLGGWIRNETDGSVTALFVGADSEGLGDELRRGPPQARVLEVVALALDDGDINAAAGRFEIV